jgi:hypothetical protein
MLSDTRLGNLARLWKPIEITDRGILACHQRRRKHPSCARLAARRDAENREGPLGRSLPWRQSLNRSHASCQLLYTVPGIGRITRRQREMIATSGIRDEQMQLLNDRARRGSPYRI